MPSATASWRSERAKKQRSRLPTATRPDFAVRPAAGRILHSIPAHGRNTTGFRDMPRTRPQLNRIPRCNPLPAASKIKPRTTCLPVLRRSAQHAAIPAETDRNRQRDAEENRNTLTTSPSSGLVPIHATRRNAGRELRASAPARNGPAARRITRTRRSRAASAGSGCGRYGSGSRPGNSGCRPSPACRARRPTGSAPH